MPDESDLHDPDPWPSALPIDPDLALDDPGAPGPQAHQGPLPSSSRRTRPDVLGAIALGGAIGTLARAGLGHLRPTPTPHFPVTTLAINVVGAFILGALTVVLIERVGPTPRLRPFLTTGILGGFTTFSTFMVESVQLVRHEHVAAAAIYVVASLLGGLLAAGCGLALGRRLSIQNATGGGIDGPEAGK